jgi:hypothetical protein
VTGSPVAVSVRLMLSISDMNIGKFTANYLRKVKSWQENGATS